MVGTLEDGLARLKVELGASRLVLPPGLQQTSCRAASNRPTRLRGEVQAEPGGYLRGASASVAGQEDARSHEACRMRVLLRALQVRMRTQPTKGVRQ